MNTHTNSSRNSLQNQQSKDSNLNELNPAFDLKFLSPETIQNHVKDLVNKEEPAKHPEILIQLLDQLEPLDFKGLAFNQVEQLREKLKTFSPESEEAREILKVVSKLEPNQKHYLVLSIDNVLKFAKKNLWGLCKNNDFIYLSNGAYWSNIDKEVFQKFLGQAAEKMGVPRFSAQYYLFMEQLFKQFLATAYLPTPEPVKDIVLVNLQNGTFEVTPEGTRIRPFNSEDFLTYQLPFRYDPKAEAPIFQSYLDRVLPDKQRQVVLSEYLGYIFIRNGSSIMKEEKALVLYGSGANGKSVFFEVVNALFGVENVSSYSLQSLTNENGYFRAKLVNKLVNYASEINGNLEASIFKQLVSGEPVEARLPYGEPFTLTQYAKLIFNCNELPREVEHTNAYFRRFLIVPFDVTIPEEEQDKQLHSKIIGSELSGVFNWVLEGLNRLLIQKRFSDCDAARLAREQYEKQSDSVKLFLEENNYERHPSRYKLLKDIYADYRIFCMEDGFKPVNKSNFIKRLQRIGINIEKKNIGNVVFISIDYESE